MYDKLQAGRILQGDILEDFKFEFVGIEDDSEIKNTINFPYITILTQDCDLEQDFSQRKIPKGEQRNQDKYIHSVLIAPMFVSDALKTGGHLQDLDVKMESWASDLWKPIKQNHNERFHYFPEDVNFNMPSLVIDFKHFYTVGRDEVYRVFEGNYKVSIKVPYRELLSHRFSNYLSRIAVEEIASHP